MKLHLIAVAIVGLLLTTIPAAAQQVGDPSVEGSEDTAPPPDASWRTVLERAVEASRASAYEGRLVVVGFTQEGPHLAEVDIAQGTGGGLRVGSAEAWMVGREAEGSFYWRPRAGTLLRLGNVERPDFSIPRLVDKYEVRRLGTSELRTGRAIALALRERGAAHDRERLYVDEGTGLVVRRETYDDQGRPSRLVAFTSLEVSELSIAPPTAETTEERGAFRRLTDEGLRTLSRTGWEVPRTLPGGFVLQAGYALPEADGSSLHLVYSDGLYTLSVYEQFGRADLDALDGAVETEAEGAHVWRWPGAEPQRMVWTGDGKTFTAISDAPLDPVLQAVADFPSDPGTTVGERLWRGLTRVARWVWPFA